jgi:tetratricopeptide (TPR) repeat protein
MEGRAMSVPHLPQVEALAQALTEEILRTPASATGLWQVSAPAGAGKSRLLAHLQRNLDRNSLVPVLVAPSFRSLDAGPTALVQVGVGLKERGRINGQFDNLTEPGRPWSEKILGIQRWLSDQRTDVVLLCDEPFLWSSEVSEEAHARAHSLEVFRALVEAAPCRRVVAGFLPPEFRGHTRRPRTLGTPPEALGEAYARSWGDLAATAAELLVALGDWPSRRSVLELDLRVACAFAAGTADVIRWLPEVATARDAARFLADALGRRADLAAVCRTWARLALLRGPFDRELLGLLDETPLSGPQACLIARGLLVADGSILSMHEVLRAEGRAREWLSQEQRGRTQHQLARFCKDCFQSRADQNDSRAILDEIEAFHHAASAPDRTTLTAFRAFFVDQLHTLGRVLSREVRDQEGAVAVFERAVEWDSEDDYGHHYLAFNLDVLGRSPQRVEEHYLQAIALDPLNVWWRSRWINFLITRGRVPEARAAWNAATDALGLPDQDADPRVYESLHLWVARLLVHRGQMDFAEKILRGIPPEVFLEHPGLRAIQRRLRFLVEAARTRVVFPLTIPPERWWQGPHLCALQTESGKTLRRWLAGRIQEMDDDGVHLVVAEPPGDQGGAAALLEQVLQLRGFRPLLEGRTGIHTEGGPIRGTRGLRRRGDCDHPGSPPGELGGPGPAAAFP